MLSFFREPGVPAPGAPQRGVFFVVQEVFLIEFFFVFLMFFFFFLINLFDYFQLLYCMVILCDLFLKKQ